MINNRDNIRRKIEEISKQQGAEVLDCKFFSHRGKNTLRCVIDYPQGGITLDACGQINKRVFSYLDKSKALGEDYIVEINSPGLDRPLREPKDFLRVKNRNILLWLREPVEKKDFLEGKVLNSDENILRLNYKGKDLNISFNKIKLGKEKIEI